VQLSPSPSLEDKEYKDEKEKKRTEERYPTSRPLDSHFLITLIPNWIRFNSAIFAWRNQSSGIPLHKKKKKKGHQIYWQNIPLCHYSSEALANPHFVRLLRLSNTLWQGYLQIL
jgi:hypothetical protein